MKKALWPWLYLTALLLCAIHIAFAQLNPGETPKYREAMNKAHAAFDAHKYDDAEKQYKKALKENHADWDAQSGLVNALLKQRDMKAAIQESRKLLDIAKDDKERAAAHNDMGAALYAQGGDKLTEAEQEFRTVSQLDPANSSAFFNLGVTLLHQGNRDQEGIEVLRKFVSLAGEGPASVEAKRYILKPALARTFVLPDFEAPMPDGKVFQSKSLHGKIVLLDFWATWCPPCREAVPEVQKVSQQFPADRFVVVSLSIDEDKGAWQKFVVKNHMDWLQCRDENAHIYESSRLQPPGKVAVPSYVLLDEEGAVLKKVTGVSPHTLAGEIEAALKPSDQQQPPKTAE